MSEQRLFKALHAVFPDGNEFYAKDVMRAATYVAEHRFLELRQALEEVLGPVLSPTKIGRWLRPKRNAEHGGLQLLARLDARYTKWWYQIYEITADETPTDHESIAAATLAKQEAKLGRMRGKDGPRRKLNYMDRQLDKAEEVQRKVDRIEATEQRVLALAGKRKPKEPEAEPLQVDDHERIFLAPHCGYFTIESKAEKRCRDMRELGFTAGLGYLSRYKFVIWIDGQPDRQTLKNAALRYLLKIHECRGPLPTAKQSETVEKIWDQANSRWIDKIDNGLGYIPEQKFIDRAMRPDREAGPQAIRLRPMSSWSPFDIFNK